MASVLAVHSNGLSLNPALVCTKAQVFRSTVGMDKSTFNRSRVRKIDDLKFWLLQYCFCNKLGTVFSVKLH